MSELLDNQAEAQNENIIPGFTQAFIEVAMKKELEEKMTAV